MFGLESSVDGKINRCGRSFRGSVVNGGEYHEYRLHDNGTLGVHRLVDVWDLLLGWFGGCFVVISMLFTEVRMTLRVFP